MANIQSGHRTSIENNYQQELSILYSHLSLSISSEGQVQKIMALENRL